VAGSGSLGDGGPATAAQIGSLQGIAADRWGNLYLSDTDHNRIRKIDTTGTITTVAGTGVAGFSGDGGPATSAQLNLPYGIAVDLAGNLYIADLNNSRVRRVTPDGAIQTYAGSGGQGSSGDGGPATSAQMLEPRNVAVDAAGNLYISEFGGNRVRKVTPDGRIATAAGTGIAGYSGDGNPATMAQLAFPAGLAVDRQGDLYIADSQNQRIRKVLPSGQISTVLDGTRAFTLLTPIAVAVDRRRRRRRGLFRRRRTGYRRPTDPTARSVRGPQRKPLYRRSEPRAQSRHHGHDPHRRGGRLPARHRRRWRRHRSRVVPARSRGSG
jgi:DNA-binding beta-propeller fold protein YncE